MSLLAEKSCGRFAWAVYVHMHVARLVKIVAGVVAGWCVCTGYKRSSGVLFVAAPICCRATVTVCGEPRGRGLRKM